MSHTVRNLVLGAFAAALPALLLAAETKTDSQPTHKPAAQGDVKPAPPGTKPAAKKEEKTAMSAAASPVVLIKTSFGEIKVKLNAEKAPITVENFLKYVNDKFYDGTIFHRVIPGFMIQGGGFNPDMTQRKVNAPIPLEAKNGLSNKPGTIAMARTSDPDSATSQFFISVNDNSPSLDFRPGSAGYAVFGEVIEGMETVDKIKATKTTTKAAHADVPVEAVVIESIRVVP